ILGNMAHDVALARSLASRGCALPTAIATVTFPARGEGRSADLVVDLGLDQPRQVVPRFLPAEGAGFWWNEVRGAFLNDIQLGADQDLLQRHGHLHLARDRLGTLDVVFGRVSAVSCGWCLALLERIPCQARDAKLTAATLRHFGVTLRTG